MQILRDWKLDLDADKVLRGQLAAAATVRGRSRRLFEAAQAALLRSEHILAPAVLYRRVAVTGCHDQQLQLSGGGVLCGSLIADHLAEAREVIVAACTVGDRVSQAVSGLYSSDPLHALSFEGLGNAAIHELGEAAHARFAELAHADGLQASISLSPGMVGWPLEEGQMQISKLIDLNLIGVTLDPDTFTMKPLKSLSFVMGLGKDMVACGESCDFCSTRPTCRYRELIG
jgi:hypothetical protein